MSKFSIEFFSKKDLPEFQSYIRSVFNEKYILNDPRYIDWQYGSQLLVAKDREKIVGHFGYRDLPYKINGESRPFRFLMNLMVLESYRLLGVGALLAKEVFDTVNPILVSGYTPLAQQLFAHLRPNWKEAGNLSRFIAVFDPSASLFSGFAIPKVAEVPEKEDPLISEAPRISQETERFWEDVRGRYPITVERTADYLNWRFCNHPFFKYSILEARDKGALSGYLIYRIEEDRGFKIARIIDFIAKESSEKPLLLQFLRLVKKEKCQAADFVFSCALYKRSLLEAGFFDIAEAGWEKFPILFSPISAKKPYINIAYSLQADLNDCYLTKADGDQDRPNPH